MGACACRYNPPVLRLGTASKGTEAVSMRKRVDDLMSMPPQAVEREIRRLKFIRKKQHQEVLNPMW